MAQINKKGQLSGIAGPVYFRVLNGVQLLQSRPVTGKKRKTAAITRSNASEFGLASRTAKKIRIALSAVINSCADKQMYQRFTSVIHAAIKANDSLPKGKRTLADGDLSLLESFNFNKLHPFEQWCNLTPKLSPAADGTLQLSVPGFDPAKAFHWPAQATHAQITYIVSVFEPQTGNYTQSIAVNFETVSSASSLSAQQWPVAAQPEGTMVLLTSVLLFSHQGRLGNMPLHEPCPCRIEQAFIMESSES